MENASKALIMAASILIGIVLLSLLAYLYFNFSSATANMQRQMEDAELENFNNKFLAYDTTGLYSEENNADKKRGLTIYDVYTVVNMAKENNTKYDYTENDGYYIKVSLNNKPIKLIDKVADLETYMADVYEEDGSTIKLLKRYECSVKINENTNRVDTINFSEKKTDS